MIRAYSSYWRNGLNFSARTSQSGYWWVVMVNVCIFIALFLFMYLSISGAAEVTNPLGFMAPVGPVVFLVSWPVINAVPSLAMTIRRLHDTGRSGVYYLFALIPVVGTLIMVYFLTCPTMHPQSSKYGNRRQV